MADAPKSSDSTETTLADLAAEFPSIIALPVFWGDQDAYAHVNNVVYFRWYEHARIAYLDHAGLKQALDFEQLGPILASVRCDYRRQLKYPDTVHIASRVTRVGRSSMTLRHRVFSEAQRTIVAEGESVVVAFDYKNQRTMPVPASVREAIAQMETQPVEGL